MKIVIIEDEAFAAEALESNIVKLRPQTQILAKIEAVEEAINWFEENDHPDLVFCDIHLSDGNSFEIFEEVEVKCPIIFTTAYNEYAIEAFKVHSIDYLLKPIKSTDLLRAITKFESQQKNHLAEEMRNLKAWLENKEGLTSAKQQKSRFMVKSGQSIQAVHNNQVAYFMAEEGIVLLVTFDRKRFAINYTLDDLESMLDEKKFFRANRQLLINIEAVEKVNPYFKGRLQIELMPAIKELPVVSSAKSQKFKEWLDL